MVSDLLGSVDSMWLVLPFWLALVMPCTHLPHSTFSLCNWCSNRDATLMLIFTLVKHSQDGNVLSWKGKKSYCYNVPQRHIHGTWIFLSFRPYLMIIIAKTRDIGLWRCFPFILFGQLHLYTQLWLSSLLAETFFYLESLPNMHFLTRPLYLDSRQLPPAERGLGLSSLYFLYFLPNSSLPLLFKPIPRILSLLCSYPNCKSGYHGSFHLIL